jgi:hypothetical protein
MVREHESRTVLLDVIVSDDCKKKIVKGKEKLRDISNERKSGVHSISTYVCV